MRDHVARRSFIDHQTEGTGTGLVQVFPNSVFILAHRLLVACAACLGIMLCLAEAAVIPPDQDFDLAAARPMRTEDVEIRVAREAVEAGLELLAIPNRSARPQIKRNRSCNG